MGTFERLRRFFGPKQPMEVETGSKDRVDAENKGSVRSFGNVGFGDVWNHPDNLQACADYYKKDGDVHSSISILSDISVGVGFYTECEDEKAKQIVDDWCQRVGLDTKLQKYVRTFLTYGFCPVERWVLPGKPLGNLQLKLLPPESVKVRITGDGVLLGYRQGMLRNPVDFKPIEIIWFEWDSMGADPYGTSKVAPVLTLLDAKKQINEDMPKITHRYAAPLTVWKARQSIKPVKKAVEERAPDEDIFIGNVEPQDLTQETVEVDFRARFMDYINEINEQINGGMQAPTPRYLRNATEASATKMFEVSDRHVQGIQRYVKRVVEREMFEVVLSFYGKTAPEQIPSLRWGAAETGLEEIDFRGIADMVAAGAISPVQAQDLMRKIGVPLEETEEKPEVPNGNGNGNGKRLSPNQKERMRRTIEKVLKVEEKNA